MTRKEWAAGQAERECASCGKSRKRRYMVRALNGPDGSFTCRNVACVRKDARRKSPGAA